MPGTVKSTAKDLQASVPRGAEAADSGDHQPQTWQVGGPYSECRASRTGSSRGAWRERESEREIDRERERETQKTHTHTHNKKNQQEKGGGEEERDRQRERERER